ncbi:hypothetical protein GGD67_007358 [Bradyrhizobium sp. IAR9]|uniref:hypothetical protein n=1 Tax=Bradyrhizobium sp. IAR9 TaxID=2663841 RepID=UPI0015CD3074|nr:hypothetical protein [Bradyrhizobium sp. IAR9]NYG49859.1 hypothetical protein [Bradyrhizobium sp. IAR9]
MTNAEIEKFFAAVEAAMNEFPYRSIPIDLEGKKHAIVQTTAWHVPADIVEELQSSNAMPRLETAAAGVHCKLQHNGDGSVDIVWDPT